MLLNTNAAQTSSGFADNYSPTLTQFKVRGDAANKNGDDHLALLFGDETGISKCGGYSGTGSTGNTITTGFQPRFVLIKRANAAGHDWVVYDSVRGADKRIYLNNNVAQQTLTNSFAFTSTGFTLNNTWENMNAGSGAQYIYYAHA